MFSTESNGFFLSINAFLSVHQCCFISKYKANVMFRASQDRSPISSSHATSGILSGGAPVFKGF